MTGQQLKLFPAAKKYYVRPKTMNKKNVILTDDEINSISGESNSLQRKVYDALIERFMNKELVPGQIINRRQVAADMNVSVAPVLEALVKLEQEGFVMTIPRKGTIVSPAKEIDIKECAIVREALEIEAVYFYCGEKVRNNYDELIQYATALDSSPFHSIEHARMETIFHSSLVNLANVKLLFQEYVKINRVGFFYKINTMQSTIGSQSQKHVDLINNLCTDDLVKASDAIRSHIRSGKPWSAEVFKR